MYYVEGKVSKLAGKDQLTKDASRQYELFSQGEKEKFADEAVSEVELSQRQMGRKARKIFCQIQKIVFKHAC